MPRAAAVSSVWLPDSKFDDLPDKLPVNQQRAHALAAWPTRLKRMNQSTFDGLVNWGYASCDVVMRKWVDPELPAPTGFPQPGGV